MMLLLLDSLEDQLDLPAALGSRCEEGLRPMLRGQASEIQIPPIQISPIHHMDRSGLDGQHIQHVCLLGLAVRGVTVCDAESRCNTPARMPDDSRKAGSRYKLHELREQRLAQVHSLPPQVSNSGSCPNLNTGKLISNPHKSKLLRNPRRCLASAHGFVS